ncbi:hypothetical protein ACS5PJ_05425 [Pseudarthrobacter sp. YS3]|uniref:hypothetical protein n=1 Tax=Pseudarthrobacter sp. YS3 TaxID=3453718 RepID=UPI003EEAD832
MDSMEAELERLGIKTPQWKWLNTGYSNYEQQPTRGSSEQDSKRKSDSGRGLAFIVLVAGFLSLMGLLGPAQDSGESALFLNVSRGAAMLMAALFIWTGGKVLVVIGSVVASLFVAASVWSLTNGNVSSAVVMLLGLASAVGIGWFGAPIFKAGEIVLAPGQRLYGMQPTEWGRGAGDSTRSSIWVIGFLLNKLVRIPGVYIFHGLKSPGGRRLDVEHAVTHGSNVCLIDSWFGHDTNYEWATNRRGRAILVKGDDGHRHTAIADAAERYRAVLGQDVKVIPLITIASGTAIISGGRWSPRGVGLFTAVDVISFIGDAAAENLRTWHDRPDVRSAIAPTVSRFGKQLDS